MERFVERFRYKATKARQAQSRVKALEKIERIERDPRDARSLDFSFGAAERTGRVVLELDDGRLEVPGRTLLEDGELWLERGEHVSLVGPNGVGKTTLIEALAERRPLDGGRLKTGHNVKLGYLSQHTQELGSTGTALEAAQRATGLTPGKARALLGQFLFSGEEAEKPLEGLSGGERRRLSLAVVVASGANVLILDEPTNHLDLDAREALEDALQAFEGAVLLVSHDRALLDAVGTAPLRSRTASSQLPGRLGRVRAGARGAPRSGGGGRQPKRREAKPAATAARPAAVPRRTRPPRGRAGARGRASRGLAGRRRGRAGRSGDVEQPDPARPGDEAARGREAGRGSRRTRPGKRRRARRAAGPAPRRPRRRRPAKRGAAAGAGRPRPGTDGASVQQGGFARARCGTRNACRATPAGCRLDRVHAPQLAAEVFCVASTSP